MKTNIIKYCKCDLISINETWFKSDNDIIDIDGCKWIGNRRNIINRRAKIGSGGVGILIASRIFENFDIELSDDNFEGILAVTFINKYTDYKFAFITAYLPPENSIYGRNPIIFLHT